MYQIDYRYLRPKKAAWLKRMYATPFVEKKELDLWQGKNATVLPLRELDDADLLFGRGGVVDENGAYVPLSGIETRIMRGYPFEPPLYKDEKVVYCGYLVNHWGHFLVEAVTRLWYVLEQDSTVDKYVFFVDENEERTVKGNYRQFFELLKIWDKLELVSTPTTYREVIVPQIAFQCMKFYSPKFLAIFDAIADNVTVDPRWERYDKIYFTRSQFASQNGYEFGLEAFDDFYKRNGYAVLAPEKIPLGQMIYLIRGASEIASMSGSTPHNMLFAANGQKLTILERLVTNDDHQVCINQMRQLTVIPIDANFQLYTVDFCGPYMLGCNHIFRQYVTDHGMTPPSDRFSSKEYRDSCFKQYMRSYHSNYQYRWFMEDWYAEITDSLYEAYADNYPYFKEYLDGERPFLREHYFQPHYWKQFLKRILKRN
ncbi:MAG: glycosyltransferase 61 family protein [Faecousia sp.]